MNKAFNIDNSSRKPISSEIRKGMQGNYPYYGPTKIQDSINEYQYEGKRALIAEDGDHFLKYSEKKMTQIAEGKFNVNNHAHVIADSDIGTVEWFYFFFQHRSIYPYLTRQGAGRYKLNKSSLSSILVALPPLPEQQKIAAILTTWDEAATTLTHLIAAKREQKRGLMQRLLTGEVKIEGFDEEWKRVRIGKLLTESNVKADNVDSRKLTVKLHLKGIETRPNKNTEKVSSTNYFIRKSGQFVYGKQNLYKGAFGIIPENLDGYLSTNDIPTFDFNDNVHPQWFLYYVSRKSFYERLENISSGTGSKRIKPKAFFKVMVPLPPFQEQTAIASILQTADREIETLEAQLAAIKNQKRGLMQRLLTGRVRVKLDGQNAKA